MRKVSVQIEAGQDEGRLHKHLDTVGVICRICVQGLTYANDPRETMVNGYPLIDRSANLTASPGQPYRI